MPDTHDERGAIKAAVNRLAAICEYVETYGKWPRTRAAKRDLELIATDVPPCQHCGRIGNHDMDQPCSAWEHMNPDDTTEDGQHD